MKFDVRRTELLEFMMFVFAGEDSVGSREASAQW